MRSQENNKKLKSGIGGGFFVPESSSEVLGSGNEGRHGRRMDEGAHQRGVSWIYEGVTILVNHVVSNLGCT